MRRTITLADLYGLNALTIVGTIGRLLKQMDREAGTDLEKPYRAEAMSGDYAHLCEVSERYAVMYLTDTLDAHEGDLTDSDDEDEEDEE
jgi:hypothetical protein